MAAGLKSPAITGKFQSPFCYSFPLTARRVSEAVTFVSYNQTTFQESGKFWCAGFPLARFWIFLHGKTSEGYRQQARRHKLIKQTTVGFGEKNKKMFSCFASFSAKGLYITRRLLVTSVNILILCCQVLVCFYTYLTATGFRANRREYP